MNKQDLEAKLPLIDKAYQESVIEMHRLEGEFRAIKSILNEWPETEEIVNAEAKPSDDLRDRTNK